MQSLQIFTKLHAQRLRLFGVRRTRVGFEASWGYLPLLRVLFVLYALNQSSEVRRRHYLLGVVERLLRGRDRLLEFGLLVTCWNVQLGI